MNIAEILKDCPKGTKLYSLIFGDVEFEKIQNNLIYVKTKGGLIGNFTAEGKFLKRYSNSECLLFPSKDNRDWNTFQRPFVDGDVVFCDEGIRGTQLFILKEYLNNMIARCYLFLDTDGTLYTHEAEYGINGLATEGEKQKLFDAIKANGYNWNTETKTLEKLIKPKFKVGDRIIYKYYDIKVAKIIKIHDDKYELDNGKFIYFQDENAYEIFDGKFNISTLKPFDKVLVRIDNSCVWKCDLYSHYSENPYHYVCISTGYKQCIPFEGNEHLLGTTNDCDEYYKNW